MVTGKDVAEAMRVAAIAVLDDRGLMPLGPAREALRGRVFAKGAPRTIGHQVVLESDIMWAALLSLEDAQEFVTYALRMKWDHRPRGRDNTAFVQRYGAGVLPWIASRVDARGHLIDEPACVVACLLAIGTVEALELLLKLAPEDQTQL